MDYDLIVIGSGRGGLNIAESMNRLGFKVLLTLKSNNAIKEDIFNSEAIFSKSLMHVAQIINETGKSQDFGFKISGKLNFLKVMEYVKARQEMIGKQKNTEYFKLMGIDVELGNAMFISKNSIRINRKEYSAKRIILAINPRPKALDVQGFNKIKPLNDENILSLKKLPSRLVIAGNDQMSFEFAQIFNTFGSKLILITDSSELFPDQNSDIALLMQKELSNQGIDINLNSSIKKFNSKKELIMIDENKIEKKIKFDQIFVSKERELNITDLDLQKANVKTLNGDIIVDDYLRTTNKNIFFCGDSIESYYSSSISEANSELIMNNFFRSIFKKKIDYSNLSRIMFTDPQIASFGLNKAQLDKNRIKYEELEIGFMGNDEAIIEDHTKGKLVLYLLKNKILGGSMIAADAGEIIQELLLLESSRSNIKNILKKDYAYPIFSKINKKIIATHFSNRSTANSRKLLRFIYRYL